MAFQNLCQKMDIDNIRAKISNFSGMPEMPHLKLPKSMSKLKSRKIFRASNENVNNNTDSPKAAQLSVTDYQYQLPAGLPHSTFIDLTPQRISTISSLSHVNRTSYSASTTYRSAHSIDDDYPSPRQYDRHAPLRPISPIRSIEIPKVSTPEHQAGTSSGYQSLVQRLQKGYKDVSEFRLKHIFAKKTVVRRDNIEVQQYVNSYNEERKRENSAIESRQRNERLDDYRFRFKESRQKSGHSYSISSNESASSTHKSNTPPQNKPGIASTRFAKVLHPPRRMSEETDDNVPTIPAHVDPNKSTVFAIKEHQQQSQQEHTGKSHISRLAKYVSTSIDESGNDSEPEQPARRKHAERKRKAPITPQQSIDSLPRAHKPHEDSTMDVIKQNFKRFHQSMKRAQPTIVNDDKDESTEVQKTRKQKITARLRKFRSHNESLENVGTQNEPTNELKDEQSEKSPIRTAFNNKLKNLKKSFKRRTSEADNQTGDEASPEKQTRTGNFIKSLRHIRSKKQMSSTDDLDDTENECKTDDTVRKASNFEERFEQARKRTLRKVNEKMQNIRFFHKSQATLPKTETMQNNQTDHDEDDIDNEDRDEEEEEKIQEYDPEEEMRQIQQQFASHAVWSTKPINQSDTNESDSETEYPRVLIHQDTSNFLESTLVIAVTRSPAILNPTATITEIPTEDNELENEEHSVVNHSIFTNMKLTAPPRQRRSSDGKGKLMKSFATRCSSAAEICNPNDDPWSVQNSKFSENTSKTRSIDIFDKNMQNGGVSGAFEDFDEALRNEPVLHVPDADRIPRNFERESSEDTDAADDDNSSRVTKILRNSPSMQKTELSNATALNMYANSRESLITHLDTDVDEDDDRPPSATPSPPPSPPPKFSPPPPPRPERRVSVKNFPNPKINIEFHEDVPPLPRNKPPNVPAPTPEPPKIPERTPSMSKVAKPLVKTSSLRLAYSEQVNPNDVGKVNKLISRFDPTKASSTKRPRIIPRNIKGNAESYSEDDESLSEPEDLTTQHNNNNIKANIPTTLNETKVLKTKLELDDNENPVRIEQKSSLHLDRSSNNNSSFSLPSSEYGSPLEYPSSLIGSAETTPIPDRKFATANLRIRRSMTKDEDVYHSFDSDEENSYYSISPSGSNRYIVDL